MLFFLFKDDESKNLAGGFDKPTPQKHVGWDI